MGEIKRRGSQADRISQAHVWLGAPRSKKLVCGTCRTTFTEFEGVELRDMPGIHIIFGGKCLNCDESVVSLNGEPGAVATATLAYEDAMEDAKLGAQVQGGKHLSYVDEEDKPTQH